jgi:modulator of FtsH protease HflC
MKTRNLLSALVVVLVLGGVFLMMGPFYILNEGDQAIITRFGQIVATETTAGLKFRMPLIDIVVRYPKRIQSWDGQPQRVPTSENQFIWVDSTARWRIKDPARFYAALTTVRSAYSRLDDLIESAARTIIADNSLSETVRDSNLINQIDRELAPVTEADSDELEGIEELEALLQIDENHPDIRKGRRALSQEMFESVAEVTPEFGIELIDIVIRQIQYSDDLTQSVYDRMVSERNRYAQFYRAFGDSRQEEILGQLDNERRSILSSAYREAVTIRGEADAQAAEIYANAYNLDPAFAEFWRAIESYRIVLPRLPKTLTTEMDYFRFLHRQTGN